MNWRDLSIALTGVSFGTWWATGNPGAVVASFLGWAVFFFLAALGRYRPPETP